MQISPLIFLVLPYLFIISLLIIGWFKTPLPLKIIGESFPFVSILIPVKNEKDNLPGLIFDLIQQDYPKDKYEIIFIDDHSVDETTLIIKKAQVDDKIKLISLSDRNGKKAALLEGISNASGEFIITTDGDCMFNTGWITAMVNSYRQYPGHLIIGPVFFEKAKGLLNQFQNLEFLSLIASGAGAAGIERPILCNGANLGASKELFLKGREVYNSSIASGDDIFLLLELKQQGIPAVFVKNNDAAVTTKDSVNIKQFFNQRTRWTFKSRFYRDIDIILVAIVVLFTNVLILGVALFSLMQPKIFFTFLFLYLLKCFVDYILLYYVAKFFNRRHLLKFFFIHQLLYVFYVSVVGIAGHFAVKKWKN